MSSNKDDTRAGATVWMIAHQMIEQMGGDQISPVINARIATLYSRGDFDQFAHWCHLRNVLATLLDFGEPGMQAAKNACSGTTARP
mgnify:CR=1 FL=1